MAVLSGGAQHVREPAAGAAGLGAVVDPVTRPAVHEDGTDTGDRHARRADGGSPAGRSPSGRFPRPVRHQVGPGAQPAA
ncbi:hypothetical protein GCM10010254_19120 [Streptomyces chromofuscus]|nr:hypothetical protein GCM10010254_19120 [Streptomyces chromofuscus]